MQIIDNHGRKINYLRLSVTDRCNLRCDYCMPEGGVAKLSHGDVLSYEELFSLAEQAVAVGIEKIRITGGEPLVRKGIIGFLQRLSTVAGLKQLVLTTNGILLEQLALPLKEAGVQRLNISLDSLRPEVFARISRGGDLNRVLAGIDAAEDAGFPVKVNMVVMRGVNDAELLDFARLTLEKPYAVRFIEYMPVIKASGWQSLVVSGEEILGRLAEQFSLAPTVSGEMSGPAREYRINGSCGSLGVITPLSGHFCDNCNRIRITASGKVRNCLFSAEESDLKPVLRNGSKSALQDVLREVIMAKPACHGLTQTSSAHVPFAMAKIGG